MADDAKNSPPTETPTPEISQKSDLRQAQLSAKKQQPTPEQLLAEQYQQGAPMPVLKTAGLTGGVAEQSQPEQKKDEEKSAKERVGQTAQLAGTGMQAAGQGTKLTGKGVKAVGSAAGAGVGAGVGAVAGAVAGALGGGVGIGAGARAGAKAGGRIGKQIGKLPGKGMEQAGSGIKKAGDKTKQFGRELKRRGLVERMLKKSEAEPGGIKGMAATPARKTSGILLKSAWLNLIPTFLLSWFYIAFHFIAAYLTPFADFFCKFGEEWVPKSVKAAGGEAVKKASKKLEVVEIAGCVIVGLILLGLILIVLIFVSLMAYVAIYPVGTAIELIGEIWGEIWHSILKFFGVE